jgi:hypothetical protein
MLQQLFYVIISRRCRELDANIWTYEAYLRHGFVINYLLNGVITRSYSRPTNRLSEYPEYFVRVSPT